MLRTPAADWLAWASVVLAAAVAAGGLFARGLYRDAAFWVQQTRGTDLATLILAAPILAVSLALAARGSSLARSVELGALLYLAYNYAIYTTSVAMNRFALLYVAVLGLSAWSAVLLLPSPALQAAARALGRTTLGAAVAWFLLAVAVLFGLLWLSQILASTVSGVPPSDLERAGLPANPVYALDLAFFLPLAATAAIAVLRGSPGLSALAVPMLVWMFLTSAGIAGGFFFQARAGEQVPLPVAAAVGLLGLLAIVLAGLTLQAADRGG
jgi:hypothetical protein